MPYRFQQIGKIRSDRVQCGFSILLANKLCPRGDLYTWDTGNRVRRWLWLALVSSGDGCGAGQVGTMVNAGAWRGATLSKSLRFMVAMVAAPSRSAAATSEVSSTRHAL